MPRPSPTPTPSASRSQSFDSIDEEDPLMAGTPPNVTPRPTLSGNVNSGLGSAGKSRLAVVLKSSPSPNKPAPAMHHASVPQPVTSDLPSATKKRKFTVAKETPVPLPRMPTLPTTNPPALTSTVSHRGRPKGWRPGMTFADVRGTTGQIAGARVVKEKPASNEPKKRRGRPPKAPSPPPTDVYRKLSPLWIEFRCEWTGCQAELQNLETLRRHVYLVHHRRGKVLACCWGKCGQDDHSLDDAKEFEEHMDKKHLLPLSWHAGEGPSNNATFKAQVNPDSDAIPDFLKDAQGKQVTPWVRDQELEDVVTWKNNRRKLKELLIRRNENLPDEDSSEAGDAEMV